jgi:hypothetical protein
MSYVENSGDEWVNAVDTRAWLGVKNTVMVVKESCGT